MRLKVSEITLMCRSSFGNINTLYTEKEIHFYLEFVICYPSIYTQWTISSRSTVVQLVQCRIRGQEVAVSNLNTRAMVLCVLEQGTSSSCFCTGSDQEKLPNMTKTVIFNWDAKNQFISPCDSTEIRRPALFY